MSRPATKNETAQDCPWADVTRATTGITDDKQIETIIEQKIPGFMDQIQKDANAPDLLALWGLSYNLDASDPVDPIIPKNLLQYFSLLLWPFPIIVTLRLGTRA